MWSSLVHMTAYEGSALYIFTFTLTGLRMFVRYTGTSSKLMVYIYKIMPYAQETYV